jgi:hypothetical protein
MPGGSFRRAFFFEKIGVFYARQRLLLSPLSVNACLLSEPQDVILPSRLYGSG